MELEGNPNFWCEIDGFSTVARRAVEVSGFCAGRTAPVGFHNYFAQYVSLIRTDSNHQFEGIRQIGSDCNVE